MPVFRIKNRKNGKYTSISNEIVNNPNLSAKAKAILLYTLSKPDNWKFNLTDITKHMQEGLTSIKSGIKELKNTGYCTLTRGVKDHNNRFFSGSSYNFYEVPIQKGKKCQ